MRPNRITTELKDKGFYYALLLFAVVLPFSEALVSIAATILFIHTIITYPWSKTKRLASHEKTVFMVIAIFGVYLFGLIFTTDFSLALYELKKVIFWIIIPVAMAFASKLPAKRFYNVIAAFFLAVFVASIIVTIRFIFRTSFHIIDFREISIISHIRFSYQVVLAFFFGIFFLIKINSEKIYSKYKIYIVVVEIWLLFFLLILKSITGIIAFIGTASFFIFYFLLSWKRNTKYFLAGILAVLVVFPFIYTKSVWDDYYDIEELDPLKVDKFTVQGNSYFFDFNSSEKENGNWVQSYICDKELREEWNKRSNCKYDSLDSNGFTYQSTLIRYMTSKGYRKDSIGVHQLEETDIRAIERGIANHIYVDKRFSLYPRIYETIWEFDYYKRTGNPNGQSLSQRIEFIRASVEIIKNNFWFGIGTGNWKKEYANAYSQLGSKLSIENQRSSHNQYLNYMVKFGFVGFVFILTMLLLPVFKEGHRSNILFWLFLVFMGIANLGDANFESHMGLSFFSFFYSLFLWHSPEYIKNFVFHLKGK